MTPPIVEINISDDGQQMSDDGREVNAQEEDARREVKRLHRWEVLQAEAAAKFRKDLEAANDQMQRRVQKHATEKEALKTQPRQHNGGGNWGKYEYVWEEPEQPVILEEGSRRSRRGTVLPESQPPAPKRRKTDESVRESTRSHNRKTESKHSAPAKRGERAHPASSRAQRPKPRGPIFSAMPASPSAEIPPVDDFDIMPLITDQATTTSQAPIAVTDDDSYDSDVEVIATSVARARAAQGGLTEEDYGSNINPISLSAEEDKESDNNNGNGNESSDEDIFYSSHFSASALHYLMPSVTDGSVNTGGVPQGTTGEQSTGVGSSRVPSSVTKGISPLKPREVFRGTLSSPDAHSGLRPESYKQPKALTERGKGTRAALEAQEREGREGSRSADPPPLLHSAEAEIARARQAAAFMESARRKPTQKNSVSRLSRQCYPSPSPTSFAEDRLKDDDSQAGEDEDNLQAMLDTIVSSQLMDVDNVNASHSTEAAVHKANLQESTGVSKKKEEAPEEQSMMNVASNADQHGLNAKDHVPAEEDAVQSSMAQSSIHERANAVAPAEVIAEHSEVSVSKEQDVELSIDHPRADDPFIHNAHTLPEGNERFFDSKLIATATVAVPAQDKPSAAEPVPVQAPAPSNGVQPVEATIISPREGSAFPDPAENMAVDESPAETSIAQGNSIVKMAEPTNALETEAPMPPIADHRSETVEEPAQPLSSLECTSITPKVSDQLTADIILNDSETRMASPLPDPSAAAPLGVDEDAANDDSAGSPEVETAKTTDTATPPSEMSSKQPAENEDVSLPNKETSEQSLQKGGIKGLETPTSPSEVIPEQPAENEDISLPSEQTSEQLLQTGETSEDMRQITSSTADIPVKPSMHVEPTPGVEVDLGTLKKQMFVCAYC